MIIYFLLGFLTLHVVSEIMSSVGSQNVPISAPTRSAADDTTKVEGAATKFITATIRCVFLKDIRTGLRTPHQANPSFSLLSPKRHCVLGDCVPLLEYMPSTIFPL